MATVRVFRSGNSLAVRLPKAYRLNGIEVEMFRRGDETVLRKKAEGLVRALDIMASLPADVSPENGPIRRRRSAKVGEWPRAFLSAQIPASTFGSGGHRSFGMLQ